MQMAQQQAAQLSVSVKAASMSSSQSFSGERKRIAHRPNPQMTSSKTSMSASSILYKTYLTGKTIEALNAHGSDKLFPPYHSDNK